MIIYNMSQTIKYVDDKLRLVRKKNPRYLDFFEHYYKGEIVLTNRLIEKGDKVQVYNIHDQLNRRILGTVVDINCQKINGKEKSDFDECIVLIKLNIDVTSEFPIHEYWGWVYLNQLRYLGCKSVKEIDYDGDLIIDDEKCDNAPVLQTFINENPKVFC